jgi:hypothetical protein
MTRLMESAGPRDTARLGPSSSVCAVIPHYACEAWLGQAIESLLTQTRPPEAVVVVDDGSAVAPIDVVAGFPGVTLVGTADNGGPYSAIQAVIDAVEADAFVFQDADDWSAPDRLDTLVELAAATGAELVGSHEVRVLAGGRVQPVRYPLDVNAALAADPTAFPLLHPTSLIARRLVVRLGGFATGMRFSGDEELLRRAAHVARIANADHFGYFRRKREGSLTTTPTTGLGSPARRAVQAALAERARANAATARTGGRPDLRPWRTGQPVALHHLAGPPLGSLGNLALRGGGRRARGHARAARPAGRAPVVVLGSPRAGHQQLAWALAQHPALCLTHVPDARRQVVAIAAARDAAARYPGAQFIHVVRDPHSVVADLGVEPTEGADFYTTERAYAAWLESLEAGLALERTLGPNAVLRVAQARLASHPEPVLADVLAFLGEPYDRGPLLTLHGFELAVASAPQRSGGRLASRASCRWAALEPQPDRAEPAAPAEPDPGVAPLGTLDERFCRLVEAAVPDAGWVAVVSRGDPTLLACRGRPARHFPSEHDGTYAGFHPADGAAALAMLAEDRRRGITHLAIPAPAFWWLAHYAELRQHLGRAARLVAFVDHTGAVWSLDAPPVADGLHWTSLPEAGPAGVRA